MQGFEEDVLGLLRCMEDGTVEVHRRITEVPYDAFKGLAKAREDCQLKEEEHLPRSGRTNQPSVWIIVESSFLDDTEACNVFC